MNPSIVVHRGSYTSNNVAKTVGASLLAKRPVNPTQTRRLTFSFREQARSHGVEDQTWGPSALTANPD